MEKEENYNILLQQLQILLEDEYDVIANLANVSALLYMNLPNINWAGFYLYKEEQLILGPFQGKPACIRIPIGRGVCGASAQDKKIYRVRNVHEFKGHIACDSDSKSEIVIPILLHNQLFGVLDIDSPIIDRFDEMDEKYLTYFISLLKSHLI